MDDRTMLKLAAKAAGIEWIPENTEKGIELEPVFGLWLKIHGEPYEGQRRRWNPLANDGDALRLAVKLKLCFGPNFDGDLAVCFGDNGRNITEAFGADHYAATRRAITRAAAEIQLAKESGK